MDAAGEKYSRTRSARLLHHMCVGGLRSRIPVQHMYYLPGRVELSLALSFLLAFVRCATPSMLLPSDAEAMQLFHPCPLDKPVLLPPDLTLPLLCNSATPTGTVCLGKVHYLVLPKPSHPPPTFMVIPTSSTSGSSAMSATQSPRPRATRFLGRGTCWPEKDSSRTGSGSGSGCFVDSLVKPDSMRVS